MLGARQRERGRVELAELQVRERGARGMGQHRAGADRAPGVRRPAPERGAAARREHRGGRRDRPRIGHDAGAGAPVAPEREHRGLLEHPDAIVGADELGEAARDGATGLGPAGVDYAPGRVPALQGEGEAPVRIQVEADPALAELGHGRGRLAGENLHRLRPAEPATRVERVLRMPGGGVVVGERRRQATLGPEARALRERLSRDERHGRAVLGRPQRDVEAGGPAADDHDVGFG